MNAVGVCNLALGRIGHGASRPIQSLSEDSESARACHRVFDHLMQLTLREHVWPFAVTASALAPVPQVVPGWAYVYAMPANAQFIHALTDCNTDPFQGGATLNERTAAFKLFGADSGEGTVIVSDQPNAWAWFNRRIADPAHADDSFRDALAWRIAADTALGLKASADIARFAADQYTIALANAQANVGNERGRTHMPLPENIRVRQ